MKESPQTRAGSPLLIGLTGGIGAGKSTVAQMFVALGATAIDADDIAREVVAPGMPTLIKLVETFGPDVLAADGGLDRKKMAEIVFQDGSARERLEAVIHPAVGVQSRQRFADLARRGVTRIVYEASLLIESGRHDEMDYLIVVVAAEDARVSRLVRRGISEGEVYRRMRAQMTDDQRRELADAVIDNSGSLDQCRAQVAAIWRQMPDR